MMTVRSINGQWLSFIAIVVAVTLYTGISLLGRHVHDMDRLLLANDIMLDSILHQVVEDVIEALLACPHH